MLILCSTQRAGAFPNVLNSLATFRLPLIPPFIKAHFCQRISPAALRTYDDPKSDYPLPPTYATKFMKGTKKALQ